MTVSLVTGAGSGIGAAAARRFGERGDHVVCADIDGDRAAETASGIEGALAVAAPMPEPAPVTSDTVIVALLAAAARHAT